MQHYLISHPCIFIILYINNTELYSSTVHTHGPLVKKHVTRKYTFGQGGRITGNLGTRFPRNIKVSHEIFIVNPANLS